ncbi:MAG: DUF3618 domain-containing protein [Gemmatimonadaceae bacterium]
MPETTTEVRADIEQTRARMSNAITELEGKLDVAQRVREHPWTAVGLAFGAGIALSASGSDLKAAQATSQATRDTSSKLGVALDGVVAALVTGVTEVIQSRIDGAVNEVVTSLRGDSSTRPFVGVERQPQAAPRAD